MTHATRKLSCIDFILERVMLQGRDSDDDKTGSKKPRKSKVKVDAVSSSNTSSTGRGSKTNSDSDQGNSNHYMSTTSSTKDLSNQLADDFKPGDFDVVCSRGKWAMNAPGNVRYRNIIKDSLARYSATTSKQEKSAIVSEIVDSIKISSPDGGFVRCVHGTWWTVTEHIAREKTGQVRIRTLPRGALACTCSSCIVILTMSAPLLKTIQSFRDMLHHQVSLSSFTSWPYRS
jgi:hypothetical protein